MPRSNADNLGASRLKGEKVPTHARPDKGSNIWLEKSTDRKRPRDTNRIGTANDDIPGTIKFEYGSNTLEYGRTLSAPSDQCRNWQTVSDRTRCLRKDCSSRAHLPRTSFE